MIRGLFSGTLTTALALVAFAANSLLCRGALGSDSIDAASFTTIRLVSGAVVLRFLLRGLTREATPTPRAGSWLAAAALFAYAATFSLAYVSLKAGLGALLLFGCVQVTMIAWGLVTGERPRRGEWLGLAIALGGLTVLVWPGLAAPSASGAALMATAGVSWGIYSLLGRRVSQPIAATANNFLRTVPMTLIFSLVMISQLRWEAKGIALAVMSGAVTSGLGYVIWYRALRSLTAMRAATVQLAVPVLSALGGVGLLGEQLTWRLLVAAVLVLSGVAWAVTSRAAPPKP